MDWTKIYLIGIGDDGLAGLPRKHEELIRHAQFLAGGERHLAFFPGHPAEKMVVRSNLKELAGRLKEGIGRREKMVVLASGDPLFYGVGGFLVKTIPAEAIEVLPHVSSMQLAFAAAKLPWDEATLVSAHAKPLERLIHPARTAGVIGVFTEDGESPGKIAKFLMENGLGDFDAIVCEKLGNEDQRVSRYALSDLNGRVFDPLNTLILVRRIRASASGVGRAPGAGVSGSAPPAPQVPASPTPADAGRSVSTHLEPPTDNSTRLEIGLPEDSFAHRKPKLGLITKSEIRILSISKMRLFADAVVWDIGAGSGSVSIESARIAARGKVYAVEKNEEDVENVRENIARFNTPNVTAICGKAPEVLSGIADDPDAVFIGGSSGRISASASGVGRAPGAGVSDAGRMFDILDAAQNRLRPGGRIVLNLATVENLADTLKSLKKLDLAYELMQVQISRGLPILEMTRFEALNPVTIVTAWRKN